MADITLINTPPFNANGLCLCASRNPISFTFRTDTIGSASFAYTWIHVNGSAIITGTTIVFNGTTYTAADNPAYGQFLTTTASTSLQVAQSIVLMLRDDPNNYQYEFQVLNTGATIPMVFIRAQRSGTAYNISLTVGSGMAIWGGIVSGGNQYRGQLLEDYKIWVDLVSNTGYSFGLYLNSVPAFTPGNVILAPFDLKFDPTNSHTFDVSAVTDTQVTYSLPDMSIGINRQPSMTRAFFIEYGESYIPAGAENPVKTIVGRSNVFYVVDSALPTLASNDLQNYTKRQPLQAFLTDQPLSRMVRVTDVCWLSFIWYSPTNVQRWMALHVIATFYDGSSQAVGEFQLTQMAAGYNTVRIDPQSWGMESYEVTQGKLVERYEVYLMESLNGAFTGAYKFSELRTFVVDRVFQGRNTVQFAWLETIGGWAGFSFFGETTTDIERAFSTFNRGRKRSGFAFSDQMETVLEVDYTRTYTISSGDLDIVTFQWLRDSLLKSPAVYLISNSFQIPIVITAHSAKSETDAFEYSLTITYQLSAPDHTLRS